MTLKYPSEKFWKKEEKPVEAKVSTNRKRPALKPTILTQETRWILSDPEIKTISKQDGEAVEAIFFSDIIGEFDWKTKSMVDIVGAWAARVRDFIRVA